MIRTLALASTLLFGASSVLAAQLGLIHIPSQIVFMVPPVVTLLAMVIVHERRVRRERRLQASCRLERRLLHFGLEEIDGRGGLSLHLDKQAGTNRRPHEPGHPTEDRRSGRLHRRRPDVRDAGQVPGSAGPI